MIAIPDDLSDAIEKVATLLAKHELGPVAINPKGFDAPVCPSCTPPEPAPVQDMDKALEDGVNRILKQAKADGVTLTDADARTYCAHAIDAFDAEQIRIGILDVDDEYEPLADQALRKRNEKAETPS